MKRNRISIAMIAASLLMLWSCQNSTPPAAAATTTGQETKEQEQSIDYLEAGQNLALQTKSALGQKLLAALGQKGPAGAVAFCNTEAIPITDSMAVFLNAGIKRVSDKPRNPDNRANAQEMAYIKEWKKAHQNGEKMAPKIIEQNQKVLGYYPIITNPMCLQCHGKPKTDINAETMSILQELYPKDEAIGYSSEELRGLFVVEMKE